MYANINLDKPKRLTNKLINFKQHNYNKKKKNLHDPYKNNPYIKSPTRNTLFKFTNVHLGELPTYKKRANMNEKNINVRNKYINTRNKHINMDKKITRDKHINTRNKDINMNKKHTDIRKKHTDIRKKKPKKKYTDICEKDTDIHKKHSCTDKKQVSIHKKPTYTDREKAPILHKVVKIRTNFNNKYNNNELNYSKIKDILYNKHLITKYNIPDKLASDLYQMQHDKKVSILITKDIL